MAESFKALRLGQGPFKNIAKLARVAELEENSEIDGPVILDRD